MRVVITGATGNLGTALLRRLAREPAIDSLVGVVRRPPTAAARAAADAGYRASDDSASDARGDLVADPYERVEWHPIELGRAGAVEQLAEVLRGADAVVHLAWLIQPSHRRELLRRVNVDGTRQVLDAMVRADVDRLVHASSVGAYSAGPKDRPVDESWPTGGVPGSAYSEDKAAVERLLDAATDRHPQLRITRMRPGLIFQRDAGGEIARYFLGPLAPVSLLRWGGALRLPAVPAHPRLVAQAVHADDVADGFARALLGEPDRVQGAFNLAADPVLDPAALGEAVRAGLRVPVAAPVLHAAAWASWQLRLQPVDAGWVRLLLAAPVMDTARARQVLGWQPRHSATEAVRELLAGLADGAGTGSPPLRERASAPRRLWALARGRLPGQ